MTVVSQHAPLFPLVKRSLSSARRRASADAVKIGAVASGYCVSAKLGLSLADEYHSITAVWPPTGIALAAVLLWGARMWPGVALGAFLANVGTGAPLLAVAGIATGNTLEALVGAYLLVRVGFRPALERVRDVLALALAGAVSTSVSATIGVASLRLGGALEGNSLDPAWRLWWLGDLCGDLLIASLLLVLATHRWSRPTGRRIVEAAVIFVPLGAVAIVVFADDTPFAYMIFPLLVAAALRFGPLGAVSASVLTAVIAVSFTASDTGPFASYSPDGSLVLSQTFVATGALLALLLGAVARERGYAEEFLRETRDDLQVRVQERTGALEHSLTELLASETRLAEAQHVARIGSWRWHVPDDRVTWSDQLYLIYGLDPSVDFTYASFLERVHAADRARVDEQIRQASQTGEPFAFDHRIVHTDGSIRWLDCRGEVELGEAGQVSVSGSAQDITERKQADAELHLLGTLHLATASAEDVRSALAAALERVCETTGWVLGGAWLPSSDGSHLDYACGWHRGPADLEQFRIVSERFEFAPGQGLPGRVWSSERPAWVADVTVDTNFPRARWALRAGLKAALAVPVAADGEVLAVLEFFVRHPRDEDERLVSVVSAAAAQLGAAIRRKAAEGALRESEERYRGVVRTSNDAFVAIEVDGVVSDWNEAASATFGWTREEMLGASLAETIIPERYREAHQRGLAKYLATGEGPVLGKTMELVALHREGHELPIELTIWPVRAGGRLTFNSFIRDVTERRRADEARSLLTRRLARSNEELEQFASTASHDLREPLRKILTFGDRITTRYSDSLPEQGRDYLRRMVGAASRMNALIDGLLQLSSVGVNAERFSTVSLTRVAREVLSDLETRLEEYSATVDVAELPTIEADPVQMRQLLLNLIGNGLKFHKAGARPRVSVGADLTFDGGNGGHCRLVVEDNGIGFDETYLERMFEPFQRLHGRAEYEGTGIGLALCRRIVERHGGTITARSTPGEGAAFVVTLPVRQGTAAREANLTGGQTLASSYGSRQPL